MAFNIDTIKNHAIRGRDFFIDLIFPIECLCCGAEGEWLCRRCLREVKARASQYCFHCKRENAFGDYCRACAPGYALDGIWIAADYDNKLVAQIIKSYKYFLVKDLSAVLGKILALFLRDLLNINSFAPRRKKILSGLRSALIMPVPLHPRRERWRGFNQAELIARELAEVMRLEINTGLKRIKYKQAQAKLKEKERFENIRGSFAWKGGDLSGENIILIDDVATTGATLNECALILKANGAGEVWGLVVAKG